MGTLAFEPVTHLEPALEPGLAYRASPEEQQYFRLTHVFEESVYYVVVTTAEAARHCGKPQLLNPATLDRWRRSNAGQWGRIALPKVFLSEPEPKSDRAEDIKEHWRWIKPLTVAFEAEPIMQYQFTPRIKARAVELQMCWLTLRRTLIRWYYFGRNELALSALTRGRKPDLELAAALGPKLLRNPIAGLGNGKMVDRPKRAGRRQDIAEGRREHTVVFDKDDEKDMAAAMRAALKSEGKRVTIEVMMKSYLHGRFREKYPDAWLAWQERGETAMPMTRRIFSYRTRNVILNEEEQARLTRPRKASNTGFLDARAPGDICEMDGTGGRLWLIMRDGNGDVVGLGKANIYIFIDRWSRFINGVHITLSNNSYESLRTALMYAFTAREDRFESLGVDARESRWPKSRIPVEITTDRGPEFLGEQIVQSVVEHIGIVHTPLKAYFPNGKGIVERFIRTLKQKMSEELKGAYASAIKDRATKLLSEKVRMAAVETLREAYRVLVEIAIRYNKKPHRTLQQYAILKQHGVPPTPEAAYVWGLKNIAGARVSPYTDEQFSILLKRTERAVLSSGVLRYQTHDYEPVNELAFQQARRMPGRRRTVKIKVDADRVDLHMLVGSHGQLAHFRATEKTRAHLGQMTVDEAEFRLPLNRLAEKLYVDKIEREEAGRYVAEMDAKKAKRSKKSAPPREVSVEERRERRQVEDDALQRELQGKPPMPNRFDQPQEAQEGAGGSVQSKPSLAVEEMTPEQAAVARRLERRRNA